MQIEYFIGIIFLLFLAASSVISVMGWMRADVKREQSEEQSKEIILKQNFEIAELRRMLAKERAKVSFLKSMKEN